MKKNSLPFLKLSIIIILSLIAQLQSKLVKDKVAVAINCGGEEYVDEEGIVYQKDNFFDGGISSDHGLNYDISNTKEMEVYQTERWHSDTMTYSVPLKEAGKFVLILKFSEVYFSAPNEKVFDIALGKKIVIKDLDIFDKVGKAAAHDEYIEFELKDDKVFVNRSEAPGAFDAKNKLLKVRFLKGAKDNPKINAIVVYRGSIYDTEYSDKKKKLDEENRKKLQEAKKAYLIEKKHNPEEVYDEEAALNEDDSILIKDEPSIFQIFFTVHGAYVLFSFLFFLVLSSGLDFLESEPNVKVKQE